MEENKAATEKKAEYIICRVCGYIESADKRDQPCPACGYSPKVWMDYKPRKINATRLKLLDLHIHPIAVHFPIVGTTLTFIFPILALFVPLFPFLPDTLSDRLYEWTRYVSLVLPLLVVLGGVTGYVGGKLRYKTNKAPLLKQKIIYSIIYFALSVAQCLIAYSNGVNHGNVGVFIVMGLVSSVLAAKLGKMGSYLFAGKFGPYVAG